ncbi:putative tyrosyl-DNA phosphodiesterase [Aspergillus steynii IBT 23096]|uniref:Putative tyrosyl-DNA phosphodiesterase n=1 Tax=Aspergillus steynii IBT 23096 TaxID=1392250 RepID=A0A2I2G985_9EURO|nr:putative tyrosyl-DNA phosphodiesterase [Aspergillus steynii IBT 23096]PLB49439.1 putative tyrosyl-DNA phosphodiesterase [Aspergillus steynii IBT 23096]
MSDSGADDQNDRDIRQAIAASLREFYSSGSQNRRNDSSGDIVDLTADTDDDDVAPTHPKSNPVIGIDTDAESNGEPGDGYDDDDDEDLRRAIELSKQDFTHDQGSPEAPLYISDNEQASKTGGSQKPQVSSNEQNISKPMGVLGLDRKQMEQERLARLAKRKPDDTSSFDERETKQLKVQTSPKIQMKKDLDRISDIIDPSSKPQASRPEPNIPSPQPSVQFPTGVVKKTWSYSSPRLGDDIKIEEVFQKAGLELAVLSSFMWDMDWLFSKLDTRNSRFLLMMQAKEDSTKRQYESETKAMTNLRLCFPPMEPQVNCMHSKLMLLFHKTYLRVVVPTANLTPFDWGEKGGVMENSVFLIDLPKRVDNAPEKPTTAFYENLVYFLKASTLHENIISKLDSFDFSQTEKIAFVHTIGGSHTGNAWKRTGHCGLGRAVTELSLQTSRSLNIDFVTSSLGSLTHEFLRSLYLAAQGDDGSTELTLRNAKSFPAKNFTDPTKLIQKNTAEECKDRIRVYYPSQEVIKASRGGPQNAGTICFSSKWYEGPKFPRQVLRDCESKRFGLLMHNKLLYVRPDEPIPMKDDTECRAWAYVGSANLSESAWGRLVQDRSTKQPKLNCRNWECGVLVPIIHKKQDRNAAATESAGQKDETGIDPDETSSESSSKMDKEESKETGPPVDFESSTSLDVFKGCVPVPMELPGARYGADRKPWYNMDF